MIFTRSKLFYGWWIVAGAILAQFVAVSVGQVVTSVLIDPVTDAFGWQVWQFTLGPSLAVGVGALSGIFIGPILDQRGPRALMIIGAVASALCFYLLGQQSSLWAFWTLYVLVGLIGWNLFGPLVVNATLNKWFIRKRGCALAIGSTGVSLAGLVSPVVMTTIVDSSGWRSGYSVLAILVLAIIIPVSFIMRRTPEDHGLQPDGAIDQPITESQSSTYVRASKSFTRHEAIRTHAFWQLVVGYGLYMAALSSVLTYAIPFAAEAGFTRGLAAAALGVNGLGNLCSKAVWGYCLQRFNPKLLAVTAFLTSTFGVGLMLVSVSNGQSAVLFAGFFFYGFGFGGTIPLGEFLWASYFGRMHIGAIRGIGMPITTLGAMTGPVLIGLWFDYANTYRPGFVAIMGLYLSGAMLIWLSKKP